MTTNRLIIRRCTPEDWNDIYEYLSDPEVVKFEPYDVLSQDNCMQEAKTRSQGKKKEKFWVVCLKENNKVIGQIFFDRVGPDQFLTWEIGNVFNRHYHGKGYATEACIRMIRHGFHELLAHRIVAYTDVRNTPSWKLLERLRMRREAYMLQNIFFFSDEKGEPIWKDSYQYAILAEEWREKKPISPV